MASQGNPKNGLMRRHRKLLVTTGSLLSIAIIAALAVVFLVNHGATPAPTATISSPIGEVLVQKQSSTAWIPAVSGMKLFEGDRLKTGGNGTTQIVFFEGSVAEVGADSEILLSELAVAPNTGSTSIHLEQIVGHTINRVQKLVDSASEYEIETAAGSAAVRGTTFKSYVRNDGYTSIYCKEGAVWFTAGGVTVVVGAGQQSSAMPGGTPSTPSAFHIDNVAICSDVRGDRDYTIKPYATFSPGERAWIYFEAFSLEWNASNGTYEIWYRVTDVKVYGPDGGLYMSGTSPVDFQRTQLDTVPDYLWGALYVDLVSGAPAGIYRVELVFQDVLSGATDSITVYFSVQTE
jgi:FecR protein